MALRQPLGVSEGYLMRSDATPCSSLTKELARIGFYGGAFLGLPCCFMKHGEPEHFWYPLIVAHRVIFAGLRSLKHVIMLADALSGCASVFCSLIMAGYLNGYLFQYQASSFHLSQTLLLRN
jgi:hypothetical protein